MSDVEASTIEEIAKAECALVSNAEAIYGAYYSHAVSCSHFLSTFVKSMSRESEMVGSFLALAKTHHLLAVFSTVRRHKAQAWMNLRQLLEATVSAAYAMVNPDPANFLIADGHGYVSPTSFDKRHKWLNDNYPDASSQIKQMKKQINDNMAHANPLAASNHFFKATSGDHFEAPFFDKADVHMEKIDLWFAGNVAIAALDLTARANEKHRKIIFSDDFLNSLQRSGKRWQHPSG